MSIVKINLLSRSLQFHRRRRSEFEECGGKAWYYGGEIRFRRFVVHTRMFIGMIAIVSISQGLWRWM